MDYETIQKLTAFALRLENLDSAAMKAVPKDAHGDPSVGIVVVNPKYLDTFEKFYTSFLEEVGQSETAFTGRLEADNTLTMEPENGEVE